MPPKDRGKRFEQGMNAVHKLYGSSALVTLEEGPFEIVPAFSSGSLGLDIATKIGGFPRGRMTELSGAEGSGKSTLALHCVAAGQREGYSAAYIDAEHSFDPSYAAQLGVDTSKEAFAFSQPDYGEQAFSIAETMIKMEAAHIVVVDSIAMMMPKAEVEGEIGEAQVAGRARLVTQALSKMAATVRRSEACLILINQLRENIGAVSWAPKTSTPGGRALRHLVSLRVELSRVKMLKDGDKPVGARTKFRIAKSKFAPPFQVGEFDLIFGHGCSREGEILDLGESCGVLKKDGLSYVWNKEKLPGSGREKAKKTLREDQTLAAAIERDIRKVLMNLPMETEE